MSDNLEKRWQEALAEVAGLKDGLGMKVDAQIVETVAIFRLLGFTTTGSCAGHLKRITSGPYVTFESPEAMQFAAKARQLGKKLAEINPEYNKLRDRAVEHSAGEMQKLTVYLEGFYKNRQTQYDNRLIIRTFPMTYNCLKCQGAELAHVMSLPEREELLARNRAEMRDFTDYLKQLYFDGKQP
jgi:hypothetical protein